MKNCDLHLVGRIKYHRWPERFHPYLKEIYSNMVKSEVFLLTFLGLENLVIPVKTGIQS